VDDKVCCEKASRTNGAQLVISFEKREPFYIKISLQFLVTNKTGVFILFCLCQHSVIKPDTLRCEITEPFIEKFKATLSDSGSLL
jgi:hypothetical protein